MRDPRPKATNRIVDIAGALWYTGARSRQESAIALIPRLWIVDAVGLSSRCLATGNWFGFGILELSGILIAALFHSRK